VKSRAWIAVLVLAVTGALAWSQCSRRHADEATGPAAPETSSTGDPGIKPAPSEPELPSESAAPPVPRAAAVGGAAFDASVQHTADPCTALRAPVVPKAYDSTTVAGVTVAWSPVDAPPGPYDAPLRPNALAGLAAGILEEAAQVLGLDRRSELTIVVDPSRDEYHRVTGAPSWSAGYYDGSVVRLYVSSSDDLGVVVSTLRHELMHAQLHASIGCMPTWFNEGMAMYFAGAAPVPEWLAMLRDQEGFDVEQLAAASLDGLRTERVTRAYGMSLAMVVHIVEHGGETALVRAAHALRGQTRAEAMDLWDRLFQRNVGSRAVLDTLAHKVFGLPFGPELDRILGGPVCCWGCASSVTSAAAPARRRRPAGASGPIAARRLPPCATRAGSCRSRVEWTRCRNRRARSSTQRRVQRALVAAASRAGLQQTPSCDAERCRGRSRLPADEDRANGSRAGGITRLQNG
jgi:hypothetical protein